MDDIVVSLIIVMVTGVVVVGIFILTGRAKKRQLQHIETLAGQNGWQIEPIKERLRSGYQLTGFNWVLESLTYVSGHSEEPQQSNVSQKTIFRSESFYLPSRNLLIGPKPAQVGIGHLGTMLQEKLSQAVLGESARDIAAAQVGSVDFLERYMILANDPQDAIELLTPRVEQTLLALAAKKPVVKLTQQGLEIKLDQVYLTLPEDVENFIHFGEALIKGRLK